MEYFRFKQCDVLDLVESARAPHCRIVATSLLHRALAGMPLVSRKYVVALGMPRCGTGYLHAEFELAGFKSVRWALGPGRGSIADVALRERGLNASRRLVACHVQRAVAAGRLPLDELPNDVEAVAEMSALYWQDKQRGLVTSFIPQMQHLDLLLDSYPDAHFILNVCNHKTWIKWINCHNDMRQRIVEAELPGLPKGCGAFDADLEKWVADHHRKVVEAALARGVSFLRLDFDRNDWQVQLQQFLTEIRPSPPPGPNWTLYADEDMTWWHHHQQQWWCREAGDTPLPYPDEAENV